MTLQFLWKQRYWMWKYARSNKARADHRLYMRIIRREAALERIIARQERDKWIIVDALRAIVNDVTNYPGIFDADSNSIVKAREIIKAILVETP